MPQSSRALKDELAKKRRFAALFVNGPDHIKGKWGAVNSVVGASFLPTDADLKMFIEQEGGTVPDSIVGEAADASIPKTQTDVERIMDNAKINEDWQAAAKELRPYLLEIALGTRHADPAQVAAAKEIISRAEGRIDIKANEKRPAAGLLILPALGEAHNLMTCPRCGFVLEPNNESGRNPQTDSEASPT